MKRRILENLRTNDGAVSGQALSARLGISRVSIWKHIQQLQALGYEIISSGKGYHLINSPDVPYPWEFAGRESKIIYHAELASTMDAAKELARKGCPNFTAVIAGRQTSGRGRLNRQWSSEKGGLYFTMVLRPDLPPVLSFRVGFLASLTLARILNEMFGIDVRVKWPNDLLADECKICGMLAELEAEADRVTFINIGIGLNVNNDPPSIEPAATSLKKILGRRVSRKEILSRYLDSFEAQMHAAAYDDVIEHWKQFTVTLNRHVRVVTTRKVYKGKAVDVDDTGALILECADGSLKTIRYGDCFHQSP
ncbi:MAG: biotin--[acetyl-CoA-carboxylase] ligase [Deltaproteobacteria bacterium]|jgi:BirA family biotin operon repressor/biotin-[acetyl-CoA-carboxylase] ligase|nr:biotin--[acetyl-CoA-carboxylase] ligase [Deltaproteobacteria bacterium]